MALHIYKGGACYDRDDRAALGGCTRCEWQPSTLHAKSFVIDGESSTIGSMNFDNRSMALNDETTLTVLDRAIGQQMDRIFLDDLRCREIASAGSDMPRERVRRVPPAVVV